MDAYQRHGRALLRKAERMLGNRADAQDLVQSLFLDLLQMGESPDLPYLYRAITNRCLTYIRDTSNRTRLRSLTMHPPFFDRPPRPARARAGAGTRRQP